MTSMAGNTGMMVGPNGKTGNKIPKGYNVGQIQNFPPEMMQLLQQLMGNLGPDSYLSRLAGGDEDIFNEIEAPALKQFNALQGNIASRFSGQGMGARNSSGFQNTINSEASNFAQGLQSQRQGLQQQAIRDLMGLGNTLLQNKPYETNFIKKDQQPSGWGGIGGAALGGAGGFFAGGPYGAMQGANMGYKLGQGF